MRSKFLVVKGNFLDHDSFVNKETAGTARQWSHRRQDVVTLCNFRTTPITRAKKTFPVFPRRNFSTVIQLLPFIDEKLRHKLPPSTTNNRREAKTEKKNFSLNYFRCTQHKSLARIHTHFSQPRTDSCQVFDAEYSAWTALGRGKRSLLRNKLNNKSISMDRHWFFVL